MGPFISYSFDCGESGLVTVIMTVRRGPETQWLLQVKLQNKSQKKLGHPATCTALSPA